MKTTLDQIEESDSFDYCIIGSGPAGITCAIALSVTGKRIALLEGGRLDWSDESQALYRGEVVGDPYFDLDATRLRYFGGTSNHWGGWCRHLDEVDFQSKGLSPEGAWPIGNSDLDPYLKEAMSILEVPEYGDDQSISGAGFKKIEFGYSPPVLFSEKFGERCFAQPLQRLPRCG